MIITVAHQKGGVGKSTIALNLAVELNKKYDLKVIDLDYQKTITIFNETRKEKKLKPLKIKTIESQKDLIKFLKKDNELVLIDSGGFDSDLNRISIIGADLIITPVSNRLIEIYGLEAFKKILSDLKEVEPDIKAYILLNNIDPKASKSVEEFRDYVYKNKDFFSMFDTIIRRRSDFAKSFDKGKSVVEIDKKSKASKELKKLIKDIEKIIK